MAERIAGHVARVLNAREVAINRGTEHGVEVGMRFAILNRHGADITDPETGQSLGSVEVEKTVLKIVRVYEKLSIGRTFRQYRVGGKFSSAALMRDLLAPPRWEVETLETDETTYKQEIDEADTFVKRGDPVVQVVGDEFSAESSDEE